MPESLPKTRALADAVASRALRRDAVELCGRGLALGAAAGLLVVVASRLAQGSGPAVWPVYLALPAAGGALAGVVFAWTRRWSVPRAAREADRRLLLRDGLASALAFDELGTTGPEAALAKFSAESAAASVRATDVISYQRLFAGPGWSAAGVLLALGVAAGLWLPGWWWGPSTGRPEPPASTATAEAVASVTSQVRRAAATEISPLDVRHAEAAAQIERELADGKLSDDQARARAAALSVDAADAVQQRADEDLRRSDAVRRSLARAAGRDTKAAADPLAGALERGDLSGAADEIERLGAELDRLPPEERARRAAEWREYADALEQLRREGLERADARPTDAESSLTPPTTPVDETKVRPLDANVPAGSNAGQDVQPGETSPGKVESPPRAESSESPPVHAPREDSAERLAEALKRGADALEGRPSPPKAATPPSEPRDGSVPRASQDAKTPPDSKPDERGAAKPREESRPSERPVTDRGGSREGPPPRDGARPDSSTPAEERGFTSQGDAAPRPADQASPKDTTKPDGREGAAPPPSDAAKQPGDQGAPIENPRPDVVKAPRETAPVDADPGPGAMSDERIRELAEQLRGEAENADRARGTQRDAARLREQGRQLLNQMSEQERQRLRELAGRLQSSGSEASPQPDPGGGGQAGASPGLTMLPGERPEATAAHPVDARGEGGREAARPIAEWMGGPRREGEPLAPGATSRELRQAAESAERAVEQQGVPPAYGDLVRRVFRRYVERSQPSPSR